MAGPRIIAEDSGFRIVRLEDGQKVTYVIELPDGADALGVERWRDVRADSKIVTALMSWIIRTSLQKEQKHGSES